MFLCSAMEGAESGSCVRASPLAAVCIRYWCCFACGLPGGNKASALYNWKSYLRRRRTPLAQVAANIRSRFSPNGIQNWVQAQARTSFIAVSRRRRWQATVTRASTGYAVPEQGGRQMPAPIIHVRQIYKLHYFLTCGTAILPRL